MKFISTRSKSDPVTISKAICQGLAPDGGLYMPENYPKYNLVDFMNLTQPDQVAFQFLAPFFENDPLLPRLGEICQKAMNFPIPVNDMRMKLLELFHGPTASFKDVGARFLAQCFEEINNDFLILVATSGDTGGAVAAAFENLNKTKVCVLYPKGMVSSDQEQQLTCWGNNILSLRVRGDFDSCQAMVKKAFTDLDDLKLSSANSINIGRLLPQCVYYVMTSMNHYKKTGLKANFIIPTGNMGNSVACILTKKLGFPIDQVTMACNANTVIPDYFRTGAFNPRKTITTLANAMDVGNPSNMERFLHLEMTEGIKAHSVSDEQIQNTIKQVYETYGQHICPHTATAISLYEDNPNTYLVATAHPAKFIEIMQNTTGSTPEIPIQLEQIRKLESSYTEINPDMNEFIQKLRSFKK